MKVVVLLATVLSFTLLLAALLSQIGTRETRRTLRAKRIWLDELEDDKCAPRIHKS